jgi:hypothetical protein
VSASSIQEAVTGKCGAGFGDTIPATLKEGDGSSSSAPQSSSAAAFQLPVVGLAAALVASLAGALFVIA